MLLSAIYSALLAATVVTAPGSAAAAPAAASRTPAFLDQVIPVLTRGGCNAGACHGAAPGKNGFRLSLLGYDPEADHDNLLRQGGGRRINRAAPEASLLLRKAAGELPHGGGARFRPGSAEMGILADWIAGGAPGPDPRAPEVMHLVVAPTAAALPTGSVRPLRVTAHYTDGGRRDVTALARFASNAEHLATVNGEGRVTLHRVGEAVIRVSFRGNVAVARLAVPSSVPVPAGVDPWSLPADSSPLDRAVFGKLRRLRFQPSPGCTDAEFLRRAYLDLTGAVPPQEAADRFLREATAARVPPGRGPAGAADAADVRRRLVERLLESPEFTDLWTYRLGDLLRSTRRKLGPKGNRRFHEWLRAQVAANRPWDQLVRELLTSRGSLWDVGPANFYGTAAGPEELAEITSQEFLGIRLQCARCHDHPFDRWRQADYYRFAAFFARMQVKNGGERGDPVVVLRDEGDVKHPKSGAVLPARSLDGAVAATQPDPRLDLADWLTAPGNQWFARNLANRVWKHLMGRGLVDPVDDVRASNPPSNEEALTVLAAGFQESGYDLRELVRTIATSRVYQLAAVTNASNRFDESQFSHHIVRRLSAEQLLDSLVAATGVPERFAGAALGTRAAQLSDTSVPSYLLDLFGRPARAGVCECEREDDPNLAQVLHFMNGESVNRRLLAPGGRLARLLDSGAGDATVVRELFMAALTREPNFAERAGALAALARAPSRRQALADLFWALLNSREFLFTH